MYISIGKNLKLESTNDQKISKFVRDYSVIHDMIEEKYPDTTQPIILKDLLESLTESFVISWDNLPCGASFVWTSGGQTLPNPYNARNGQNIDYVLTYSDGSKCIGSFIVDDNYTLDLSTLEPNKFILTITANKTLSTVRVYHNYVPGSTNYEDITTFVNNTITIECNRNENVRISSICQYWSEIPKIPDFMNIYVYHDYSNITSNISETYNFAYESYSSFKVSLKNENGEYINLDDSYLSYITWTPSDSNKFVDIGISGDGNIKYYAVRADKSITVSYTINVPNYATVSGTFPATSLPVNEMHTKILVPMITYRIVPNPSSATVTMTASGYNTVSGIGTQSITVAKGTTVVWLLECEGYVTKNGSTTVNSTSSDIIPMEEDDTHEINITDYEYTNIDYHLELNNYIGSDTDVTIPNV